MEVKEEPNFIEGYSWTATLWFCFWKAAPKIKEPIISYDPMTNIENLLLSENKDHYQFLLSPEGGIYSFPRIRRVEFPMFDLETGAIIPPRYVSKGKWKRLMERLRDRFPCEFLLSDLSSFDAPYQDTIEEIAEEYIRYLHDMNIQRWLEEWEDFIVEVEKAISVGELEKHPESIDDVIEIPRLKALVEKGFVSYHLVSWISKSRHEVTS